MWWSNLWREQELTEEELNDLSIETVKQEMLSIYRGYYEPIPRLIAQTGPPVKVNIYDILRLPAWHKHRVALIGDAACREPENGTRSLDGIGRRHVSGEAVA